MGRISGQRYAPPSRKCIMFVPALFNCFFPSSPMSDGPIHVIKYSNSIQEINWLYSLFASVIPGVSTRSLDRTKLIVYTTDTLKAAFILPLKQHCTSHTNCPNPLCQNCKKNSQSRNASSSHARMCLVCRIWQRQRGKILQLLGCLPFACLDRMNVGKDTPHFLIIETKVTGQRNLVLHDSSIQVSVYCHQGFDATIFHYAYADLCVSGKHSPRRDNLGEITFQVFYVPV